MAAQSKRREPRQTLSVPEAAEILGISAWLLYEQIRQGNVYVLRFGRKIVVPRASIDRMLQAPAHLDAGSDQPSLEVVHGQHQETARQARHHLAATRGSRL